MTEGAVAGPGPLVPALIVEDDPATQSRLQRLLGAIVGDDARIDTAGSAEQARASLVADLHRLALVDISLPGESGIRLIARLQREHPAIQAVVVSSWADEDTILGAIQAGAIGYLLKSADDLELTLSLKSLQRGGAPIDPGIARRILEMLPARAQGPAFAEAAPGHGEQQVLTPRETDILQLVARGLSNR